MRGQMGQFMRQHGVPFCGGKLSGKSRRQPDGRPDEPKCDRTYQSRRFDDPHPARESEKSRQDVNAFQKLAFSKCLPAPSEKIRTIRPRHARPATKAMPIPKIIPNDNMSVESVIA